MKPVGHRAALVSGAGSAFGRSITAMLAVDGYRVCASDPDALALHATALVVGRHRIVALAGPADDVDHQDDVVERALGAFGRIDVLVNVIDPATVWALVEADAAAVRHAPGNEPFQFGAGPGAAPLSWIEKVDVAGMAERGTVVNVFSPVATSDGRWPARVAGRLSRFSADLQDRLGSGRRVTSLLPPPSGSPAGFAPRRTPLMPLRTPATVPEAVSYLVSRRGHSLAGRTLMAERPGVPWRVVDAPLPAPSSGRRPHPADFSGHAS
jgi:NAD(P)-dependent dehydrogenase (short-subunit alcohol dehydrogenase family)